MAMPACILGCLRSPNICGARLSLTGTTSCCARGFDDLRLRYTTNGSEPLAASPSFEDVLDLYAPVTLTFAPFRGNVQYQASQTFQMVPNLALGDSVTFVTPPAGRYSAGLTDGILGGQYHDGAWAGWQGA